MNKTVDAERYDLVVGQNSELGERVRSLEKTEKHINRFMDALRRITQLGVVVILIMFAFAFFVNHPATDSPHKQPAIGALAVICVGYAIALEYAQGHFGILFFVILAGVGIVFFSGGMIVCRLNELIA